MPFKSFTPDEILTAADVNNFLRIGYRGISQRTADQNGITTEADLTDLSVTVTLPADRRIKVTVDAEFETNATDTQTVLRIKESTTQLQERRTLHTGATASPRRRPLRAEVWLTPSQGEHTYKATATSDGTTNLRASATKPAFIAVEDVGPA